MKRAIVNTGLTVLAACLSFGQTGGPPSTAFEVVSIKRNNTDGERNLATSLTPGRYSYPNATVFGLLRTAFGVSGLQLYGGPGWVRTERYDINATINSKDKLTLAQLRPLLQAMLADRFKLEIRHETQLLPIYALAIGKNGPNLKGSTSAEESSQLISGDAAMLHMKCTRTSMTRFATTLEGQFGGQFRRNITDDTGLKGDFDFTVSWATDQTAESAGLSIFDALQEQLGLKLESRKAPVEIIQIDSIQRPSEN
jgi:uncharacterized protein (TIGR03435 family)